METVTIKQFDFQFVWKWVLFLKGFHGLLCLYFFRRIMRNSFLKDCLHKKAEIQIPCTIFINLTPRQTPVPYAKIFVRCLSCCNFYLVHTQYKRSTAGYPFTETRKSHINKWSTTSDSSWLSGLFKNWLHSVGQTNYGWQNPSGP